MDARLRRLPPVDLIAALHAAFGLAFGLATPLFEAPDEANHFLFVRYLQLHRALPAQTLEGAWRGSAPVRP